MALGKLKVTLGMHMVRHYHDLLGPGTLKYVLSQLKNKSMNWADFLQAGNDGIIFSLTINHSRYLWLLNAETPL